MMNRFILLLLFFSSSLLTGQTALSKSAYNSSLDSLINKKKLLKKELIELKAQLDSLKIEKENLDELIAQAEHEIEMLYVKKFGKKYGPRVYHKQIWKGMTEEMLRAGWGKPDKIDKNVEKWGVFTQWYYGKITFFFRDGKLIDWEEEK